MKEWEGSIEQLHLYPFQCLLCWLNIKQVEDDRLVWA